MDRKTKIEELKRKNKINIICKKWKENGVDIAIENFLDYSESVIIQKKIIEKLNEMDKYNNSIIYAKDKNKIVYNYKQKILYNININDEYVFFINESAIYVPVIVNGKVLKDNIDFIISQSGLFNNSSCILCCSKNIKKGLCLWLGEYDDHIYIW